MTDRTLYESGDTVTWQQTSGHYDTGTVERVSGIWVYVATWQAGGLKVIGIHRDRVQFS